MILDICNSGAMIQMIATETLTAICQASYYYTMTHMRNIFFSIARRTFELRNKLDKLFQTNGKNLKLALTQ
eukprot:1379545-Amorphochlora_amoeboformis.AAC.2